MTGEGKSRDIWRQLCEKAAADAGKTYEEVVADLEAGRAELKISFTLPPPKDRQH